MNVADLTRGQTRFENCLSISSDLYRDMLSQDCFGRLSVQHVLVSEMSLLMNVVRLLSTHGVFVLNL
jgi:hypothetical protein